MVGFGSKAKDIVEERRAASRLPLNAEIWADPGGTAPAIVCQVRNISPTGARLSVEPGTNLPDRFLLKVGADTHEASVVWRLGNRGSQVGVKFDAATT